MDALVKEPFMTTSYRRLVLLVLLSGVYSQHRGRGFRRTVGFFTEAARYISRKRRTPRYQFLPLEGRKRPVHILCVYCGC